MEETSLRMLIDLVKNCSLAGKRYCFILGAGASRASGIKTGAEMAKIWLEELEKLEEDKTTKKWIEKEKIDRNDPGAHYPKIYGRRFRLDPADGFIRLQNEMKDAIPSPGYYHLAKILAGTYNNLVITTNFDSLTEDSLFIYEDKKALVITHESLAKYIDVFATRPTIIKLHRDLLLQPKNNESDVNRLSKKWGKRLKKIMETYIPIVIGYGGNDGSLMGFLETVSSKDRNIYWCYKRGDPVNDRIGKLLEAYHGFKVPIDDFDDTMQAFGKEFDFYFSEKTIRDIINKRAEKLIDKFKEMEANRRKALSKKEAEEPLSSTESITFDYLESSRKKRVDSLESSIEKNPQKADYYYDLGTEYFFDDQYGKAVECLTKAIELDPKNAKYYYRRGINYNGLNEFEKAVADLTKAIELDPNNAEYYNWCGINYNDLDEFEKAVTDHTKAIELDSNNATYFYWRSINYKRLNQFEKAVADLIKAIELDPNNAAYYYSRGVNYHWLNEFEKTIADMTKAIELDPDNALYYTNLARVLCYVGNVDSALNNLNKALSLNKDLPDCYNVRGFIELKKAKRAGVVCGTGVLNDLDKAIELGGASQPNARFYTDRAEYYLYSDNLDNAYNDLNKALAIYSRYGRAYYFLAKYYEAKGNKQECENCMTKVKEYRYIPADDD